MDNKPPLRICALTMKPKQRFVTRLDGFGSHREFIPEGILIQADAIEKNMFFCDDGWYFMAEFTQVEIEITAQKEVEGEEAQ